MSEPTSLTSKTLTQRLREYYADTVEDEGLETVVETLLRESVDEIERLTRELALERRLAAKRGALQDRLRGDLQFQRDNADRVVELNTGLEADRHRMRAALERIRDCKTHAKPYWWVEIADEALSGASPSAVETKGDLPVTDEQIKYMVSRFLGWRLPENFSPDAGISFKPEYNVEYNAARGKPPARHEPIGTNLFSADEAEAMVRYMVEGVPPSEVKAKDD